MTTMTPSIGDRVRYIDNEGKEVLATVEKVLSESICDLLLPNPANSHNANRVSSIPFDSTGDKNTWRTAEEAPEEAPEPQPPVEEPEEEPEEEEEEEEEAEEGETASVTPER
jgi:hypothetical protein